MQTTGGRSGCLSDANGPQGWMTDRGEEQTEAKWKKPGTIPSPFPI